MCNEKYFFVGCTLFLEQGSGHYISFIYHQNSKKYFFYDALGSEFHNIELPLVESGKISLLAYFRIDSHLNENDTLPRRLLEKKEN